MFQGQSMIIMNAMCMLWFQHSISSAWDQILPDGSSSFVTHHSNTSFLENGQDLQLWKLM